jgi:5-methylcytosine-specific restriction enzyme subunit McrC
MRTLSLTEASEHSLEVSDAEASALQGAGCRLIGTDSWWGHTLNEGSSERSVLRCARRKDGRWSVRVGDVVGLVVIGDLQLVISSKIPISHLLYLLRVGGYLLRFDLSPGGGLESDSSFWDLIATWFISSLENVLRVNLMRDYREARDFLPVLRGRLNPLATSRSFYRGRIGLVCEYENFDFDSPLNRLLKAAARKILAAPVLDQALRRRGARALARMDQVGELATGDDANVVVDRRTHHYSNAAMLARHVLRGQGRFIRAGQESAWTFLIRTPEPVEAGLRELIRRHLPEVDVRKQGITLGGTKMTLNPDVVFGAPIAIGDVKYKWTRSDWERSDLYQLVAFATGYRVRRAGLFGFCSSSVESPIKVTVGEVQVTSVPWIASTSIAPIDAAEDFVARVSSWLSTDLLTPSSAWPHVGSRRAPRNIKRWPA